MNGGSFRFVECVVENRLFLSGRGAAVTAVLQGGAPCLTFIFIVYPNPAPKEKRQFSQGVCKKPYKMPKSMLSPLQKSVKAAFLSRVHNFGVQLFCTLTDCTNGVQKSGCTMQKIAVC
jgi:hypothetical protein